MSASALALEYPTASSVAVSLMDLAPGTEAILQQMADAQARGVLRSLGLIDGARLRVCRIGDPCIIQVGSTRIGLSSAVARSISVIVADRARP